VQDGWYQPEMCEIGLIQVAWQTAAKRDRSCGLARMV